MDTKLPDTPEMKLHFLDYWRIIRLRKAVILLVFLLVVISTVAVTLWLPKTYASRARIKVEKDMVIGSIENKQNYSSYDPFWLQTEFEVIQSSSVLNDVIKRLGLNEKWAARAGLPQAFTIEQTYEILKKQISVRQSRNTSLIEIWVYSEDVNEAPEIANTIAQAYRDYRKKLRTQVREEAVVSLREQLTQQEGDIKAAQQIVNEMRRTNNIPDFESSALSTATLNEDTLRTLEQLRITATSEYLKEASLLQSISGYSREELRNSLATVYFDSQLITLAEKLATGQQQLTALLKEYTPEHAEVKKAQAIVDLVQTQLDDKIDGILLGLKSRTDSKKKEMDEMTAKVEVARTTRNAQAAEYGPYFDAKRELENLQRVKDALILKIRAEAIETAQPTTSAVETTDAAVVMPRPVEPKIPRNIAIGIVVGLIVGVGLAFFIEYLDTSVKTIDDVERALQAPVLGVIPQNVGVLLDEGPDTPHAEAYRVLRTNVLFSRKDERLNTLSVLSGGAGEGKSTTLLNLATIFAQNGSRCLIVDSDLRRPSIHKVLKLSNSIGLTNYLLKQNSLEEVIQTTRQLPTLDFMPSGKLPSSSMGILSSEKMKELILELKQRYDFVFFDSPPLLGVSDASILASEMDMVLQVVQYRRYPQPMTLRAKQMVQKVGGNLLGIVLNNINMSQDENYYYYSGYYEYSKQDDEPVVKSPKAGKRPETTKV
jgi:capsular exopolysaccharide synthesis family protein